MEEKIMISVEDANRNINPPLYLMINRNQLAGFRILYEQNLIYLIEMEVEDISKEIAED